MHKSKLQADLKAGKTLTSSDEEWLDGAGNLVDEEHIVELLEKASDDEEGVRGLSGADKAMKPTQKSQPTFIKKENAMLALRLQLFSNHLHLRSSLNGYSCINC